MTDSEFVNEFYPELENELQNVVINIKHILTKQLGAERLRPHDNLAEIFEDIDFFEIVEEVREELDAEKPSNGELDLTDGTFDSIVKCFCKQVTQNRIQPD